MGEVLILGGGMAGVGAALALQARGRECILLDRRAPGEETSFGNAGVIQAEAREPYAMPRDFGTLLCYALGRSNDVVWSLRDAPALAPALMAYFRASALANHARVSAAYAPLIARATEDHAPLIAAAGAEALIRRSGLGELYRNAKTFDAARAHAETMAGRYGLRLRALGAEESMREDPAIKGGVAGALIWDDSWSCTEPGGLVAAYAKLFEQRGGRILRGDAETLEEAGAGWRVRADEGVIEAKDAVVALGPWSGAFLARFGCRVPMILKRGYHTHLNAPEAFSRPYLDAEHGYVLSSMKAGLRVTTGAELVRQDRPSSRRQLDHCLRAVAELTGVEAAETGKVWRGHRPCMPDMLPVVGPAPGRKGLWLHFGHGHQGFTLGPTTGALLAALMEGETPPEASALLPAARPDYLRGP